jgi:hypothetical protein
MDYLRVCAVDAGTRNFAYCVADNMSWQKPLVWRREDLWAPQPGRRGKPSKEDVVDITHAWCKRNEEMIKACDVVVLENQLRKTFMIMNTVIATFFYGKVKVVHPMTVGSFFKLSKTREQKKRDGVAICRSFTTMPTNSGAKADDLADAWLMCVFQLVKGKALSERYFSENN